MFGLGIQELLIILCICLVLFGAGRLPELGSSLGKAIKEFGKAMKEIAPLEKSKPEEKK